MKTLHVLNGDGTAEPFGNAQLPGDVAVWREMLSEGPLCANPRTDDELWTMRRTWLMTQFGDRLGEDQYGERVVAEFDKICRYADYDEVIFWFEHDLFCQINLVFLLACFARVNLGTTVLKQVSVDRYPGMTNFKGLGQLTGQQLATLYPKAETLTAHELNVAAQVWPAYAAVDIPALEGLVIGDFGRLRYLAPALLAHIARAKTGDDGLGLIEHQLISLVRSSPKTVRQVVGEWLAGDRFYGLGDWSVEQYLDQLIEKQLVYVADDAKLNLVQ